jgi:hypothetical protein
LFTHSFSVLLCYKLSPLKHTGEGDTAPTFSGLHVYLLFMWELYPEIYLH